MNTRILVLVRGVPGAGKSTFANNLRETYLKAGLTVAGPLEADDFFVDPNTGAYNYNPSLIRQAHESCQADAEAAMQTGFEYVIVSNTSTTEREVATYTKMATQYNYQILSLVVENRHGNKSVHGVPEEAMTRMKDRFSVKL